MTLPETAAPAIDSTRPPLVIELVVPALEVAGLEMVVFNLARQLRERGHEVGVTCIEYAGPLGERLAAEGVPVRVVPAPGLLTLAFPKQLSAWFRARRPDIVHVHSGAWLKAARAALFTPARTVYTLHGIWPDPPWFVPAYTRIANALTHTIVAVSVSLREHLIRSHGVRPSKVRVIENGVDVERFYPGPGTGAVRDPLRIPRRAFVFGTVARLHSVKNHALMLEAFAMVHEQLADTALIIVGEGTLRDALEQQIARLRLENAAFLFGPADDLPPVYRDFDSFVLSSLIEGTSISALEAMASGVPVIATAVGGNPRLLADGDRGLLVPTRDPAALARAMLELVRNDELRTRLAAAGRAAAVDNYSLDRTTDRYLETYYAASRKHAKAGANG